MEELHVEFVVLNDQHAVRHLISGVGQAMGLLCETLSGRPAMRSRSDAPDPGAIAIAALSHFATDARILNRFFALTGLDAGSLREAAGSRGFTAGVLDFVLSEEQLLAEIAAAQDTTPEAISIARQSLDALVEEDDWPPRTADDWA
ncbi:MAG: DUF3572 domain-containing protein [Pseudomonadota bacterium]